MKAKIKFFSSRQEILLLVFLSIIFFVTRLWNILDFPLFCDEALYLSLAEKIRTDPRGFLSPFFTTSQPLFMWLVAIFHIFIKDLILTGRLVSVLTGFLNIVILYLLLRRMDLKKEACLAVLFFVFSPLVLAYNRLAMLESISLLGMTSGVYGAVCLSQKPNFLNSLFFGFLVSLGVLTKATAFFVYPLSLLVLSFFLIEKKEKKKERIGFFIFGWLISFFIYFSLSFWITGSLEILGLYNLSIPRESLVRTSLLEIEVIKSNFWRELLWLRQYFTSLFFWLFVVSSFFVLIKRSRGGVFFVCWFLLVFCFEILVARIFFPRYLFPLVVPVVVIPAIFLFSVFKNSLLVLVTGLIFLIQVFSFDHQIIFNPEKASWPGEDRFQFFEDWTSGKGYEQVAAFLQEKLGDKKIIVYTEPYNLSFINLKFHPLLIDKKITFSQEEGLFDPIKEVPGYFFKINKGEEKYIIRNRNPGLPKDWPVKLVKEIPKSTTRKIEIYQVLEKK